MYGSTAHVDFGGTYADQVEGGWRARFNNSQQLVYRGFTELVNAGIVSRQNGIVFPCSYGDGDFRVFKVFNDPTSSNTWTVDMICPDGAHLWASYPTGYSSGVSMGEDFRRGGVHTGMSGEQNGLQFQTNAGGWSSWNDNHCDPTGTTAYNWYWDKHTAIRYTTEQGVVNCPSI
jgi:hypothetical protein